MTKQETVLALLGRFVNGLTVRDLQSKLELSWFNTDEHRKEVRNCVDRLRVAGHIEPHYPDGPAAVTYWRVVAPITKADGEDSGLHGSMAPEVPEVPEALKTADSVPYAPMIDVFDPIDAAGIPHDRPNALPNKPIAQFEFSEEFRKPLPEGVRRVFAPQYEAADGTRFTALDIAAHHACLLRKAVEFVGWRDTIWQEIPTADRERVALLLAWEGWQKGEP